MDGLSEDRHGKGIERKRLSIEMKSLVMEQLGTAVICKGSVQQGLAKAKQSDKKP